MKFKELIQVDKKKFLVIAAVDLLAITSFMLLTWLITSTLKGLLPTDLPAKEQWQLLSGAELQYVRDSLLSFLIGLISVAFAVFIVGMFIFNLSRKYIWESLNKKNELFKGFMKYTLFNSILVFLVYVIVLVIVALLGLFLGSISYVLSYIHPLILLIVTLYIPGLLLIYGSMTLIYYLNNSYFQNKGNIKKTLSKISGFNLKKYIAPIIFVLLLYWTSHIVLYLLFSRSSVILSILLIVVFSLQTSYLKLIVNAYEKKKLFGIFKKK